MKVDFIKLSGPEAKAYITELANLRIKVFHEYPYLYDGSIEYEKKYLETYFKAKHSFIMIAILDNQVIGATTGIWAEEEEASFKSPFENAGFNPKDIFYFGESVLMKEYRGQGFGKRFFEERETFARQLGFIKTLAFCAVEREINHALKPADYQPLDKFWNSQGFHREPGLVTNYEWKDCNEEVSTSKTMQFWLKQI